MSMVALTMDVVLTLYLWPCPGMHLRFETYLKVIKLIPQVCFFTGFTRFQHLLIKTLCALLDIVNGTLYFAGHPPSLSSTQSS